MTDESQEERAAESAGDRRKPVARYVEFGDEEFQERFVLLAESAYQRLAASDQFEGRSQIEVRTPASTERRGLFKRPRAHATEVPVTPALARVARAATDDPRALEPPNGCAASRRVAQTMASVATDLVRDLLVLDPAEQAAHPAYRQTLRLSAELEGVRTLVTELGCPNPAGCVGIRLPEHWGRRVEDVEVSEVRSVLHRLDTAGENGEPLG